MISPQWNDGRSRNRDLIPDGGEADDANGEGRNAKGGDDRVGLVWRLAAVFAGVTAIWLLIFAMSDAVFEPEYNRPGHVMSAVLSSLLTVPLVVLARQHLDKRPLAGLGLTPFRSAWRSLLLGMGCYLLPAGVGLGAALAFGWVELSLDTSAGNLVFLLLSLAVLVFLYEALPEELAFRGYLYRNLSASFSRWLAVGGQAVLFCLWAVAIGAASAPERLLIFFFVAVVLGTIRVITGDLWACIGFHLAFQTVQQFFGGGWADQPFVVSDPVVLENIVFGLVPLALAVLVLRVVVREEVEWRSRKPDPAKPTS